jgi:hypothetical protein
VRSAAGSVTAVALRRGSWRTDAKQALDLLEQALDLGCRDPLA